MRTHNFRHACQSHCYLSLSAGACELTHIFAHSEKKVAIIMQNIFGATVRNLVARDLYGPGDFRELLRFFWYVTLCSLVDTNSTEKHAATIFRAEEVRVKVPLKRFSVYTPPKKIMSYPRRPQSSYSLTQEPQNSQTVLV
jgi:hypothetical protein